MEFERHRRWNIFSLALVVTLLSLVMLPAVNSQENETNSSLPYIDPLVSQEVNQHGWALSLVTVNNSSSVDVVMSGLPPSSFVLIQQYPENSSFSANISWQAFDILANDTNVTSIYLETIQENQSTVLLPYVEPLIYEKFDSGEEWVRVVIRLKDILVLDATIATLPVEMFQLIEKYPIISSFTGNITRAGLDILSNDTNVTGIFVEKIGQVQEQENTSNGTNIDNTSLQPESTQDIPQNSEEPVILKKKETISNYFLLIAAVIFSILMIILFIHVFKNKK